MFKFCQDQKRPTINRNRAIFFLLALFYMQSPSAQDDEAQSLYEAHRSSIYQIRVIELSTGNKATIGSGFLATKSKYVVTNYHVVSQLIQEPSRYRIESVAKDGRTDDLQVIDIDVVHDIAILKSNDGNPRYMELSQKALTKGARIYSLGNPHDLGMSVVEGTYNGFLQNTMYEKIFVSASLNSGMSGGPTIDRSGRVIGINVSSAGNQLSFLVPVKYLKNLLADIAKRKVGSKIDFDKRIEQQLFDNQSAYMSTMLANQWDQTKLGDASLPSKVSEMLKCWGDSDDDEDALIDHAYSTCQSDDRIFLASDFTTGSVAYSYNLYTNINLSTLHFFNIYSTHYGHIGQTNRVSKEHVGEYNCHSNFIDIENSSWKMAFCARNYKKYRKLYDVVTSLALTSKNNHGLVINLGFSGVSKQTSLAMVKKFVESIKWQK